MKYLYQIFQNFKNSLPLFTIIGVFATILNGLKEFPEDQLPIFLKHYLLLIYISILFVFAILLLMTCILKPLVSSGILLFLFQHIFKAIRISSENSFQIIVLIFILIGIGTIMTYGVTIHIIYGWRKLEIETLPSFVFFKHHIFSIFLGLIFCIFLSIAKHSLLKKITISLFIFSIILLVFGLILNFNTYEENTKSWFTIEIFSLKYFDLIKLLTIIYVAYILSYYRINFISLIPVITVLLLIILLGKNTNLGLGTISLLFVIIILMVFAKYNCQRAVMLLFGIESIALLFLIFPFYTQSQQLGGILGTGFGESQYKLIFRFDVLADYIFLIITEEFGLIGASLVIFLFFLLTIQGTMIAIKSVDIFDRLLVFGATSIINLQAFLNILISLKVIPFEEISLPFVSYGGIQMLINLCFVGLILNASKRIKNGYSVSL